MTAIGANMGGQFGDTTFTKVFVGGLAWETQRDTLSTYFEQFGEILEAVVITDKSSGRSKGYGFVTFRDPEAALRACEDPAPVIDGRRANCNLAYLGISKSKSTSPKHGKSNLRGTKASQSAGIHGGIGMGSFPSPVTFPQYAVQQGVPYNVYGYSPYSPDYAYPMNYYGLYGGGGAQYPMYGGGAAGVMPGHSSTGFYPAILYDTGACGGGLAYAQGCQGLGVAMPRSNTIPLGGVTGFTPPIYGGPPITYATLTTPASQGMTVALMTAPTQMISLVPRSYRIIPTHVLPPTAASEKPLA